MTAIAADRTLNAGSPETNPGSLGAIAADGGDSLDDAAEVK